MAKLHSTFKPHDDEVRKTKHVLTDTCMLGKKKIYLTFTPQESYQQCVFSFLSLLHLLFIILFFRSPGEQVKKRGSADSR